MKNEALMTMDERLEHIARMKEAARLVNAVGLHGRHLVGVVMQAQDDEVYRQSLMNLLIQIVPQTSPRVESE